MTEEIVLRTETRERVAWITLSRPDSLNALNRALRDAIADAVTAAGEDPEVACIVLTGAGDRAFCAGLDLKELGSQGPDIATGKDPVRAIEACPKPVIAAVNGVAITGGFELVLACDIILASENARFADTHARVGLIPGWGLSQRLSRVIGIYRAKELSLTGNFLSAETAERWGLVNRVVARADLLATAAALAADIASTPADMNARYKRVIDRGFNMAMGDAIRWEQEESARFAKDLSADALEARRADVLSRGRSQRAS